MNAQVYASSPLEKPFRASFRAGLRLSKGQGSEGFSQARQLNIKALPDCALRGLLLTDCPAFARKRRAAIAELESRGIQISAFLERR